MSDAPVPRTLRTPDQPMAFTPEEMLGGALTVWLLFLALLTVAVLGTGAFTALDSGSFGGIGSMLAILAIVLLVAAVVSIVVMVFGMLLVRIIARAMRSVRSIPMHLAVYAALGALIGMLYLTIVTGGHPLVALDAGSLGAFLFAYPAIAVTIAVPLGWWWTARCALRADAAAVPAL